MSSYEYDDDLSEEEGDLSFEEVSDDDYINDNDNNNSGTDVNEMTDDAKTNVILQTVEYKAITPSEMLQDLHAEVCKLSGVLNLDEDDCYVLLHHFNWNGERLMEQYMDENEETRLKAGLSSESFESQNQFQTLTEADLCNICCEEKTLFFTLPCKHSYCSDCYIYYLKEKVFTGARLIKCPEPSCNLNLRPMKDIKVISDFMVAHSITADVNDVVEAKRATEEAAQKAMTKVEDWSDSEDEYMETTPSQPEPVVPERSLFERYEEASIKIYVESHSNYKWCPSPDCKGIASLQHVSKNYLKELSLEHKNNLIPIVSCPYGHSFCFMCNFESHVPVPCWITKLWVRKCKDDSETANWINANTKSCPKCESTIEKNGGCNHMTCKKCKHEFCWICMGSWGKHGSSYYNCSMFNHSESIEVRNKQEASKTSLKRYLHYYNHFTTQEQSMKGDNEFCADIENKLMTIQENLKNEVSWIELQFYKDSVNTLLRCRRTLKWSYALVYYLKNSNFTSILTDNQLHLSNNVEKLSKLFEIFHPEQIMSKKREFNSVSDYLLKREKALIECSIEGIMKNELQFNVDENGEPI